MSKTVLLAFAAVVIASAGCSRKPKDPEAEVRAAVAAMESAVEERDLGRIKELLHDGYKDAHGNNKSGIVRLLQFQFLRRQSIHVLTTIQELELTSDTTAKVSLTAAVAATPIKSAGDLTRLSAEVFELDVSFVKVDGDWLVKKTRYERKSAQVMKALLDAVE